MRTTSTPAKAPWSPADGCGPSMSAAWPPEATSQRPRPIWTRPGAAPPATKGVIPPSAKPMEQALGAGAQRGSRSAWDGPGGSGATTRPSTKPIPRCRPWPARPGTAGWSSLSGPACSNCKAARGLCPARGFAGKRLRLLPLAQGARGHPAGLLPALPEPDRGLPPHRGQPARGHAPGGQGASGRGGHA